MHISLTFEDHLKHIGMVLVAMQAGLKIKPSKCHFAFTSLSFLGFRIDRHGVRIDPDKAKPILQISEPETPQAMRSFLAMSGYYRTHLKGFAELAAILRPRETPQGSKAPWTDEERWAFSEIKRLLTTEPCAPLPSTSRLLATLLGQSRLTGVRDRQARYCPRWILPQAKSTCYDTLAGNVRDQRADYRPPKGNV